MREESTDVVGTLLGASNGTFLGCATTLILSSVVMAAVGNGNTALVPQTMILGDWQSRN